MALVSCIKMDQIPGIGKRIKEKILEYFTNENESIEAIKNLAVSCVPGITPKRAIKMALNIFELEHNTKTDSVLKNDDILEIYNQIIQLISEFCLTDYSKNKINLYFPLPESKSQIIAERQQYFAKALEFAEKYEPKLGIKFLQILKKLGALRKEETLPKVKNRIFLTDSPKLIQFIQEEELNSFITFEKINWADIRNPQDVFEKYSKTFGTVLYAGSNTSQIPDLDNLIVLSPSDITTEALFPEKVIMSFSLNASVIDSILKIVMVLKSLGDETLIQQFNEQFDLKKIKILKKNTEILDEKGDIIQGYDETLDKYRFIAKEFNSIVSEAENKINENIKGMIQENSINIHGTKILELLKTDLTPEMIREFIPPEIDAIFDESFEQGFEELMEKLALEKIQKELVSKLRTEIVEFPICFDDKTVMELEQRIKARLNAYNYSLMEEIAQKLAENYVFLNKIAQILLEFEFFYAIGRFARAYELKIPALLSDKKGFAFINAKHLQLRKDELREKTPVVPISYQIGDILIKELKQVSRLNLLSGSNSGGKTICLQTCAQAIILAQMGFPSLGALQFHPFDEIYYFKKSSGQISAGAFETTIMKFVELAESPHLKIIFADELESITEPNAAAKVIGGILGLLLENPHNYSIFVTHLIELLMANMNEKEKAVIRVDGIEAKGLDENLELIVDRSPHFNFIAKSTPELILRRLSAKGPEQQKEFFAKILKKF